MVTSTWNSFTLEDSNGMIRFKKKLQLLQKEIRIWVDNYKRKQSGRTNDLKKKLSDIDKLLDRGEANGDILLSRLELLKQLHNSDLEALVSIKEVRKAWFFEHGSFATRCNSSFVTLISKILDPKAVHDFRPISLIGSLYKVVTKILANRLSTVISHLISDVQTAFLPNRQILDDPFIINEILSWCNHKKSKQ
nr:RNA-directed DNA polymerase, eukaryota, reverse transcriptase zinc-binding domain protein [Tanacetum cinerariifolium]